MNHDGTNHTQHDEIDTATDLNERVERSLKTRSAQRGTRAAKIEGSLKKEGAKAWHLMKKRPSLGVLLTGGVALLVADAVGVGELAFAVVAAYAAYKVLRKGIPAKVAMEQAVEEIERV
ncbi:MAG: hypothetical protein ABIP39_02885 [Polyangiaceae bacterium]